ncbi:hypothetical protein GFC01_13455 [Desulfofundulus thermobenzoicus]|uniref:Uncharacterized protein n=1 Tax=Desulfofundulus thermobenzoicus TaxID=29376 RepID=A0A6N7ISZ5_9FIRM|nr:hypothetical protein [Desulfofundulus thermobenzoicus]MQL53245.1 hypothetical protein [Desulfofundulus thermobenzoicus]HHW42504.1 hypothetical protein [Desulfotomaculum sp.]
MPDAQLQYYGTMEPVVPYMERLRQLTGQQVTVYVANVTRHAVGSLEITGMLHAVGIDYVEVHIMVTGAPMRQVIIPIGAIGLVTTGGPLTITPGTAPVMPPLAGR